jgi:hypothetical protein
MCHHGVITDIILVESPIQKNVGAVEQILKGRLSLDRFKIGPEPEEEKLEQKSHPSQKKT